MSQIKENRTEKENGDGFQNPNYTDSHHIYETISNCNMTNSSLSSSMFSCAPISDVHSSEEKIEKLAKCDNDIGSPESNDSGFQSDENKLNSDYFLYSSVNKQNSAENNYSNADATGVQQVHEEAPAEKINNETVVDTTPINSEQIVHLEQYELPIGWIRCCDEEGIYYWHKPTGTVTRTPPAQNMSQASTTSLANETPINSSQSSCFSLSELQSSLINSDHLITSFQSNSSDEQMNSDKGNIADVDYNLNVSDEKLDSSLPKENNKENEVKMNKRFHVQSLGWVKISEFDLTPERSSKAVNKCIYDLSRGFKDYNDVVARWGEGKELYMDIIDTDLILRDPIEGKILNKIQIQSIRVWGVGRASGRDFAYVARDKSTKEHMCHVFRCDGVPAKEIANTLKDVCRQILIQRGLADKTKPASRPNCLPDTKRRVDVSSGDVVKPFSIPIDEPKKVINCYYIGSTLVKKPSGMETLNEAIDSIYKKSCENYFKETYYKDKSADYIAQNFVFDKESVVDEVKDKWINADVTISPSAIYAKKHNDENEGEFVFECRVRYLSFMGISTNPKICGIIVHCADNTFKSHAFYCEPSAGPMCKTIEAACKLRYQKCLDANPDAASKATAQANKQLNVKGLGTQIRNIFDTVRNRVKR